MKRSKNLSRADMVLLAMFRLTEGKKVKIPYEEIVIQAWKSFPNSFSLRNHPEFPDASDIHKRIYQNLQAKGLAKSLGNKFFRLTQAGIDAADSLEGSGSLKIEITDVQDQRQLTREQEAFIRKAKNTRAFQAWPQGGQKDLVDFDARIFFQYGVTTNVKERKRKVKLALEALLIAVEIGIKDAATLYELALFLNDNFIKTKG